MTHKQELAKRKSVELFTLRRNNPDGTYGIMNNYRLFMNPPRSILTFNTLEAAREEMERLSHAQRIGVMVLPITVSWKDD